MRIVHVITLIAGLALFASEASAHAFIKTASPAVGSTVETPPSQVVIDFTEGVEPLFSTIAVLDAQGGAVPTGAPHLVGDGTHLAVDLKPLPPGDYTVVWHATSIDTHKTEGHFAFTVKP
jgi:hypothetical protein